MFKSKSSFFLKQNSQVIYAIVLILLIPLAIILNTIWSVKSFQQNIDVSLQRQALLVGQLFNTTVYTEDNSIDNLQAKINNISEADIGLRNFDILNKQGDSFEIIASSEEDKIGFLVDDLNYVIAWHQNEAIATLVAEEDERFWEIAMPLNNIAGQKDALLSLRLSLGVVDDLARDTLTKSYIILAITVVIVMLLLTLNTRLFEHAILFKKLKEVDKMKDEFISIASHELRTPITTLKGFLSMILEGDYGQLNEQGKKGLKIMESSVNRLGNLVEDLLNISRIEQNRLVIKNQAINIVDVLGNLADEFDLRMSTKGLEFKRDIDFNLPKIWVDEDRFRQIVINLLGNAVKYTKKGEVELTAKKTDNKLMTITIKDSGIGMTAKERENLFEKFYRVQDEETKGIVGTGLGLWITKQIVELMGGEIFVDSIKHVGSQFYFTVPIYNKLTHKEESDDENNKQAREKISEESK